ncbi:TLD-domain-containing protein [Martensiomyces pterosporus]|nr:TLD-domain-containing protein [Martensiomyces pterosporus]
MHVYRATGFNSHYQYFNYATKTLPNGLGVGGQLEHFGLWIDSAFTCGHSSSTATFDSEQLSHGREFSIEAVEAWLVRPSVRDDGDVGGPKMSALDTNPDAVAMLEMANKTMYSKMVREPQLDYDSD